MKAGTRARWFRYLAGSIVAILLIAGNVALSPAVAPSAQAADAADWDPGYIIDDRVFYDSGSMNAGEVQSFLNTRVRACRSGYVCLKDYAQSTDNRPADAYCNGYTASARESAAQIIDNVARSCGISQRVLLVLLEKEQSLVTSTAPSSWNYSAAMGQGCPDTAPCNPATQGFFYQVYYGARQFEIYRLNPNSFGYRAQRWNNILYNPDTACGTRSVFINNQATAALYIYTPYTPNAAALANMYGTGDGCSAYGNRNFWRLFTDWFGNPRSFSVHPGFVDYWNARGGAGGAMGSPTSYPVFVEANGQGWYQRFQGGVVYGSNYGGTAFVFDNVILAEYNRQGGPWSGMSWPSGEQVCGTGVRCSQSFVAATISTTPQYGAHVLWGGINDYWKSTGGTSGALGAALNDVSYRTSGVYPAWVQNFERGVLVQSPYGYHLVPYGPLLSTWLSAGGGEGWIGWPASAAACTAAGCAQSFGGGVVTSSAAYGGHVVSGGFVAEWQRRGGLATMGPAYNELGTSSANGGGWVQSFASGVLAQSGSGFALVPYGAVQSLWSAAGGQQGSTFGWPQSDQSCAPSGCGQQFQYGAATESPSWGTHAILGGLSGQWRAAGGVNGYGTAANGLRYATANGGGWIQHFTSGILTQQRAASGVVYTPYGRILQVWAYYGGETTWLGWPAGAQTCGASGCTQQFQNGVARSDAAGAVSFLPR